jgi:glycosyltransferase involved in cell wall biosynthesis
VRVLRKLRPEITDFSTPKAGLLGNLAAWAIGVPHRVYTLRGLKLESSSGWKRGVLLRSERIAAACAHRVLCNSESLLLTARALKIAAPEKLFLLGEGSSNGVDAERFSPDLGETGSEIRRELGIGEGEVVLGFVGRLTQDKGVPELLEAFEAVLRKAPQTWLLLVGWFDAAEDALSPHSQRWIREHPRIVHTGYVPDTAPYYRAMDVLILATHREGFPNVVLEAAASGVPAITTESTGARDAVVPEVTGLLVPPRYPEAIAEAALTLIRDEAMRKRMGAAARARVIERFSKERVLGLAVEFYKQGLKKRD